MENTIISKLSLGTMGIKGAAILGQPESIKRLLVATIFGKVGGSKTVEDKLTGQVHTPLTGTFQGINHLNENKEYQSGLLYLPGGVHDQLLNAANKLMDESEEIDFALEIYAVRAGNAAGYSYEATPLLEPKGVDPLAEIRKQVDATRAKLAAPAKSAELPAPAKGGPVPAARK